MSFVFGGNILGYQKVSPSGEAGAKSIGAYLRTIKGIKQSEFMSTALSSSIQDFKSLPLSVNCAQKTCGETFSRMPDILDAKDLGQIVCTNQIQKIHIPQQAWLRAGSIDLRVSNIKSHSKDLKDRENVDLKFLSGDKATMNNTPVLGYRLKNPFSSLSELKANRDVQCKVLKGKITAKDAKEILSADPKILKSQLVSLIRTFNKSSDDIKTIFQNSQNFRMAIQSYVDNAYSFEDWFRVTKFAVEQSFLGSEVLELSDVANFCRNAKRFIGSSPRPEELALE